MDSSASPFVESSLDLVDHPPNTDRLEHATRGIRLRGDDRTVAAARNPAEPIDSSRIAA